MDKEILKYLDKVGSYIQGASEQGFKTYVHGVFIQSLIYSIFGVVLVCLALTLILVAWKLFKKEVYMLVPERTSISPFRDNKVIPEHQERDGIKEQLYRYIALGMGIGAAAFIFFGIVFILANITGVFAPDYEAIKNIISSIKRN